jgi:hypothetical protein
VQKSYDHTLFTANVQLILAALPKGSKYNQDYFIDNLFPALNQVRTGNVRLTGLAARRQSELNRIVQSYASISSLKQETRD